MRKIRAAIAAPILFRDMLSICKYSPRFVIEFSKSHVSLIPLCNLVVKYHIMLATHYRTATFFTLPSLYFTIFNPLVGADNR